MIPSTGVIIPSAGKGSRMDSLQPKQLLEIGSVTVLGHTIDRILQIESVRHLVIPVSADLEARIRDIAKHSMEAAGKTGRVSLSLVPGGAERMHSVRNGLLALMDTDAELVMVHDAVRPCFPFDAVIRTLKTAASEGAAILAVPARDTVKLVDEYQKITSTPDRSKVWLAQTPQIFRKQILFDACEKANDSNFVATDDASLVECADYPVFVIEGSQDNIKITYPSDLYFAENWLKKNK